MTGRTWSYTLLGPVFSANGRYHWAKRAQLTDEWRETSGWIAKQKKIPPLAQAYVVVEWVPKDKRRRDPSNIAPAVKACVDGLVDAGVLEDDDAAHLVGPDCRLAREIAPDTRKGEWRVNVIITEVPL